MMTPLDEIIKAGEKLGYTGEALQNFVEHTVAREERAAERAAAKEAEERQAAAEEAKRRHEAEERQAAAAAEEARRQAAAEERRAAAEQEEARRQAAAEERRAAAEQEEAKRRHEAEQEEARRRHELEMKRLEVEVANTPPSHNSSLASTENTGSGKAPKLPPFKDGQDELDSYLLRYERFAKNQKWDKSLWASYLSALLSGAALDVYSRMSDEAAVNYDMLKEALLNRYGLTEDGYRHKFRSARPLQNENPEQLVVRLTNYLDRWIELSEIDAEDAQQVKQLFIKEQFIRACPEDLAIYLGEQDVGNDLPKLTKAAERYLKAHRHQLHDGGEMEAVRSSETNGSQTPANKPVTREAVRCYFCNGIGHKQSECIKKSKIRCVKCNKTGHDAVHCRTKPSSQTGAVGVVNEPEATVAACAVSSEDRSQDYVTLPSGEQVPFVEGYAAGVRSEDIELADGLVNGMKVKTLRDTGCSGVVVKKKFLKPENYTGEKGFLRLLNKQMVRCPVVRLKVDTPYFKGEVTGLALSDMICDLIIGNIKGAKEWHGIGEADKDVPDPTAKAGAQLATTDSTLEKYMQGDGEVWLVWKNSIHRLFRVTDKKPVKQVLLPKGPRKKLNRARNSTTGGERMIGPNVPASRCRLPERNLTRGQLRILDVKRKI